MQHIGIVGAGIAGLACAEELARQGFTVQLFDKGRAPGGRMSSRRMQTSAGEALFDHGAQYFTARDEAFQPEVARWSSEGIVAAWPASGTGGYVGVPGMDAPVRFLAARQSVRWTTAVRQIVKHGTQWRLLLDAGDAVDVDVVLVATPAEQAAGLLATVAPPFADRARATTSEPCWSLMLAFNDEIAVSEDCWRSGEIISWAARNSSKPGREGPESWVIQAGPSWSRQHLEAGPDEVSRMLRAEFACLWMIMIWE